jgi:transcriptional regulator with XRE-family HTH domain
MTIALQEVFMEERADPTFGAMIRSARQAMGLSQRALAGKVGIDFTYLSKLENKPGDIPSEETIRRLARELGLDVEDLLARAGKISAAIRELAASDREFATFLRRLPDLAPEERRKLYERAGRRK